METKEINELLTKMNALSEREQGRVLDSSALMVDPIVSNRLAVELLQKLDRDAKPEVVLALPETQSYFGYSVALSAWMKFGIWSDSSTDEALNCSLELRKNEKVVLVLDVFSEEIAKKMISFIEEKGAKPVAVLSVIGTETTIGKVPCHCLI